MDANLKVLMDATGCSESEARAALSASANDITRAMEVLQGQGNDVLVFQVKFVSGAAAGGQGYMLTIVNLQSENVVHSELAYPLSEEQARKLDVNMPPSVFGATLKSLLSNLAERHRSSCKSNLSQLKSKMSSSFSRAILADNRGSQLEKINERFGKIISGLYNEEFKISHTARAQSMESIESLLNGHASIPSGPVESASKLFGAPDSRGPSIDPAEIPTTSPTEQLPKIVLICEPEIAPFDGKPAKSLYPGDEVIVKIKDGRDSARYFSELLGGCVNDEIVPLAVPLVKTDNMSETFVEAYVEFGPGIYGQFFVPPDVKVKIPTPDVELYDPFANEVSLFSEERFGRHIMAGLIFLIVSTIVLIFTFLKYS